MHFEEFLLLLLPIAAIFGVPLYIFLREKMVRKKASNFSRKRVIKLTLVNFFLNTAVALYFLTLFSLIISRAFSLNFQNVFLATAFLTMICLTFYGNGIYITSIALEAFTLPQLRFNKQFKTQFIATHLFHGPISHVFIYSGWILALLFLSILDLANQPLTVTVSPYLMVLAGGVVGVYYAGAQIYNGTVPYQFITGIFSLLIFSATLMMFGLSLLDYPVSSFFFGFIVAFIITLTGYFIFETTQGENVDWDRSGY